MAYGFGDGSGGCDRAVGGVEDLRLSGAWARRNLVFDFNSECPHGTWADRVAPHLVKSGEPLTLFNVGANKGFMIPQWLARFN